jgi:hypothetical protein
MLYATGIAASCVKLPKLRQGDATPKWRKPTLIHVNCGHSRLA